MDSELFLRLIRNLLAISAITVENPQKDLRSFEENSCFNKLLQPMFTTEALSFLLESSVPGTIYEIVDRLGVCATFFSFQEKLYLLGPYVKSEYSDSQAENLLIENHIPSSHLVSLRLYYTSLPFTNTNQIQNVLNGAMLSFIPGLTPYNYRRLSGFIQEKEKDLVKDLAEAPDYSDIYRRYDSERQFLSMIKNGDIENVRRSYDAMSQNGLQSVIYQKSSPYTNPLVSIAIIRALSRKAAEESGLSVITINEITQHYVQLIDSARNQDEQMRYAMSMILDLTKAVHEYKMSNGKYSSVIQKTMEFIFFHLSEEITLPELAQNANVSESYLSKIFKKETGETISQYIASQRCKKAADSLLQTNLPIQEISDFVGYSDNNYFVKVFKKVYGETPSEYRSSHKEHNNYS